MKKIVVQLILDDPNDDWNNGQLANYFLKALKFLCKKLQSGKIEDTVYIFGSGSVLFYEKKTRINEKNGKVAEWSDTRS